MNIYKLSIMTKSNLFTNAIDLNTTTSSLSVVVPSLDQSLDLGCSDSANSSLNSSTISAGSNTKRRSSRASDTLLVVASTLLKLLGVKATSSHKGAASDSTDRKSRRRKEKDSSKAKQKIEVKINFSYPCINLNSSYPLASSRARIL